MVCPRARAIRPQTVSMPWHSHTQIFGGSLWKCTEGRFVWPKGGGVIMNTRHARPRAASTCEYSRLTSHGPKEQRGRSRSTLQHCWWRHPREPKVCEQTKFGLAFVLVLHQQRDCEGAWHAQRSLQGYGPKQQNGSHLPKSLL